MRMISDVSLNTCRSYTCDVDIPSIDVVALGYIQRQTLIICPSVNDLHLGESNALFISRCGRYPRDHHQFYELLSLHGKLAPLGFF